MRSQRSSDHEVTKKKAEEKYPNEKSSKKWMQINYLVNLSVFLLLLVDVIEIENVHAS